MSQSRSPALSKTQLDRLGERLRDSTETEDDLRALDDYRRSFRLAYDTAAAAIREKLSVEATGREAKTTVAISQKLRRQSIRLTQIQDIAGLRVVTADFGEQQVLVGLLMDLFGGASVDDRRTRPSHGYRAVHVIVQIGDKPVEIQVRTEDQHLWAELSERIADAVDPAVKYGAGPEEIRSLLRNFSEAIAENELQELKISETEGRLYSIRQRLKTGASVLDRAISAELQELESEISKSRALVTTVKLRLRTMMRSLLAEVKAEGRHS